MTATDLLPLLPDFRSLTAGEILAHPAWGIPSDWPAEGAVLRAAAVRPADLLSLRIRFESDEHVLGLADTPIFPDLHRLWSVRAELPAPLLLALVEKEAGPLLQFLENLVRRQVSLVGLAEPAGGSGAEPPSFAFALGGAGAEPPSLAFTLTLSPALTHTLGELRRLDPAHTSIADLALPGRMELAAFALGPAERAALAPGDSLLVPELAEAVPHFVADVLAPHDPDLVRVVLAEPATRPFSSVVETAELGSAEPEGGSAALILLAPTGAPLASVRRTALGETPALEILSVLPQGA